MLPDSSRQRRPERTQINKNKEEFYQIRSSGSSSSLAADGKHPLSCRFLASEAPRASSRGPHLLFGAAASGPTSIPGEVAPALASHHHAGHGGSSPASEGPQRAPDQSNHTQLSRMQSLLSQSTSDSGGVDWADWADWCGARSRASCQTRRVRPAGSRSQEEEQPLIQTDLSRGSKSLAFVLIPPLALFLLRCHFSSDLSNRSGKQIRFKVLWVVSDISSRPSRS